MRLTILWTVNSEGKIKNEYSAMERVQRGKVYVHRGTECVNRRMEVEERGLQYITTGKR